MGGEKLETGRLKGYLDYSPEEIHGQIHHEYQTGCKVIERKYCSAGRNQAFETFQRKGP